MDDLEESFTESSFVSDGNEDDNEDGRGNSSFNDSSERDYDDDDEKEEREESAYDDEESEEENEEKRQQPAVPRSPPASSTPRGSSLPSSPSSSPNNNILRQQQQQQRTKTTETTIADTNGPSRINAPPSPRLSSNHNQNGSNRSMGSTGSNGGSSPRRTSSRSRAVSIGGYDHQLSWKSDPISSFSDWRIEIQITEDDENDKDEEASNSSRRRRRSRITPALASSSSSDSNNLIVYHIHRNIVGFGPRRSDYLTRMFRKHAHQQQKRSTASTDSNGGATSTDDIDNIMNENNNVTNLQLTKSLANVFPMVLDFMYYNKSTKSMMTSEKACLVLKLSEVLDIPALQNSIVEFYRKNASLKNMDEFISNAIKVKVPRLELVAKAQIGSLITEKPALAGLLPPKFLEDILKIGRQQFLELQQLDPDKYTKQMEHAQSKHWSKVAFICVSHNKSILTSEMFTDIFSEELLPAIDSSIALRVLSLEYQLQKQQRQEGTNTSSPSASVNSSFSSSSTSLRSSQQTYTNLQKRCVTSITSDWQNFTSNFDSSPDNDISGALKALPSHVLADILVKSMNKS